MDEIWRSRCDLCGAYIDPFPGQIYICNPCYKKTGIKTQHDLVIEKDKRWKEQNKNVIVKR